ncbi:Fc.00g081150.m01.CDS01 [Cosmosporella sp. VM-42]
MSSLNQLTSRNGTIRRTGTRKGADGPGKRAKGYDAVQQSIKQLYPPEDKPGVRTDVDIVLVPGLGANPEDSWKSAKTGFNWTTHEDGIIRDFPRARIMLYMYESAWIGHLKDCKSRPIVFIGHSMGGLVIAKAVTYADSRRDLFPVMFEAISATIFFGTPFNGAKEAAWAAMYARIAERFGQAFNSKLLEFMKPGAETLRELRHEFMRLVGKLNHKIQVVCFWEQEPTDLTKMAHLPALFGLTKALIPKSIELVSQESAALDGVAQPGLACNHRDLVKFDGPKDKLWSQTVREHLKRTINGVHLTAKNRVTLARDLDLSSLKGIMEALGGTHVEKKRRDVARAVTPSSWITGAAEYLEWFGVTKTEDDQSKTNGPCMDCLWIRGREGRGKSGATIAALEHIEAFVKTNEEQNPGEDAILVAYFLCEHSSDYCTAEDLLKSLLCQLIHQQNALATHAKVFVKKKVKDVASKSQAQPTVENLWQCLQDMISDEFVGRRVYFVLSNLHVLPEESDSTAKLMSYLGQELTGTNSVRTEPASQEVSTRWLITSRDAHSIGKILKKTNVRLVDLEDEKYGDKVQMELRRHAKIRVTALETTKHYNKALVYFASSLIGKRAQNIHWIDITCVQLEELPDLESHLKVRRVLEETPQDLSQLLNEIWKQIFKMNADSSEKIKEILRTLILTFEDPSVAGLGVLAGVSSTEEEKEGLQSLIEMCKPFLTVKKTTVGFMSPAVKDHLIENSYQLLGLSAEETKWQHGMLALRSLMHIKDAFDFPEADSACDEDETQEGLGQDANNDGASQEDDSDSSTQSGEESDGEENLDFDNGDTDKEDDASSVDSFEDQEEESEEDPEAEILKDMALAYPVKHWLHHGSKATAEFADELSQEEEFWERDSAIRKRWLVEYTRMTGDFENFEPRTLSALHVAASIGFRQLVVSLLENGYDNEKEERDSWENTPLHFAAAFGRPNIVEELLDRGAAIDDGEQDSTDTPLHMAAQEGHVHVMKKLLIRGAKPNTYSEYSGFAINAAISSGNFDAVELLVQAGVALTSDRDDVESPLAQAAAMSDISMLEYLMQQYANQLPPEEYSKAMISAAGAGRVEMFKRLLNFEHKPEDFQWALNGAAEEAKWDIVTILLERRSDLDCDEAFYQAAIGIEVKDDVLEALWEYTQGSISSEKVDDSLYEATDREKYGTVKLLLDKFGADANATGEEFGNALTAAAYDGRLDMLQLLLNAGADVNSPNGWAIQTAAEEGHEAIVRELLNRGADVNAITSTENFLCGTALQGATEGGRRDIVELLLQHNADPNLGGGDDAPPILAAAMYAEEEILAMLINARADVNVVGGDDQSTPLINAIKTITGTESLQKLLDAGADINLPGGDGETALMAAARNEVEILQFLLDNGADVMQSTDDGMNALKAAMEVEDTDCLEVLVNHVSSIMSALKHAVDSGNTAVADVIQSGIEASKTGNEEADAASESGSVNVESRHDGSTTLNDTETETEHGDDSKTVEFFQQNIITPPDDPVLPNTQVQSQPFIQELEASLPPGTRLLGQVSGPPPRQQAPFSGIPEPGHQRSSTYMPYSGDIAAIAPQFSTHQQDPATPIKRKPAPTAQNASWSGGRYGQDQNGPSYQAYTPGLGPSPQGPVGSTAPLSQPPTGNAGIHNRHSVATYQGMVSASYAGTEIAPNQLERPPMQQNPYTAPATVQPYRDSRSSPQLAYEGQRIYSSSSSTQGNYPNDSGSTGNANIDWPQSRPDVRQQKSGLFNMKSTLDQAKSMFRGSDTRSQ